MTRNLCLRLATAAVGIPLLFLVIWFHTYAVAAVAAVAALIAAAELMALVRAAGWRPLANVGIAWGAIMVAVAALDGASVLLALAAGAIVALAISLASRRSAEALGDWLITSATTAYVALPLAAVVLLRAGDAGIEWLAVGFLVTFAVDTGAYAVGRIAGRHKMAPSVSPGKTWEGAAGGLLAGVGAAIGLIAILDPADSNVLWAAALLGTAIAVAGQVGDLLESKLKRLAGAKDSGVIVPGHGGLLDRLDSLLLTLPLAYYASNIWPTP